MIQAISIENYKSIEKLELQLGRINVFIGENGAGKSNILEAIALAGAAEARKLDNEFLASRGIRVSGPELMRSAFKVGRETEAIKVSVKLENGPAFNYELTNDNQAYSTWQHSSMGAMFGSPDDLLTALMGYVEEIEDNSERSSVLKSIADALLAAADEAEHISTTRLEKLTEFQIRLPNARLSITTKKPDISQFIIYAPENTALRIFDREGQIEPLGINGEGLLKLLGVMASEEPGDAFRAVKESLKLFNWFEDLKIVEGTPQIRIEISDQFLSETKLNFDQRSANEGFLFLAFYFALFTSNLTPRFFAIDNVDSSLNPKLCEALMRRLAKLATENDKQVLLTTHNASILDGLDIEDPEQRLFIVSRGPEGPTRVRRFAKKPSTERPRRLSELFLSGALGGLPKGF